MGSYLREELERKGMSHYVDQMEGTIAKREGTEHPIRCFECLYSMFGRCPVDGHKGNAACLTLQKSYFDMSRTELEEITERLYKEELQKAAKSYHIRMDFIKNIAEAKGEKQEDEQETLGH